MDFHPDKCSILSITRSRKSTPDQYTLLEQTLQSVTSAKYLGVTLQHDVKWDQHFNNIIANASKSLAFLRRNLKICAINTKQLAYKSLVRLLLEYASTVWDPHIKTVSYTHLTLPTSSYV